MPETWKQQRARLEQLTGCYWDLDNADRAAIKEALRRLDLLQTFADEVAARFNMPCPCCDGKADNGHTDDCTFWTDCPAEYESLSDEWVMVRQALTTAARVPDAPAEDL